MPIGQGLRRRILRCGIQGNQGGAHLPRNGKAGKREPRILFPEPPVGIVHGHRNAGVFHRDVAHEAGFGELFGRRKTHRRRRTAREEPEQVLPVLGPVVGLFPAECCEHLLEEALVGRSVPLLRHGASSDSPR